MTAVFGVVYPTMPILVPPTVTTTDLLTTSASSGVWSRLMLLDSKGNVMLCAKGANPFVPLSNS
jgi:hypothetical protein